LGCDHELLEWDPFGPARAPCSSFPEDIKMTSMVLYSHFAMQSTFQVFFFTLELTIWGSVDCLLGNWVEIMCLLSFGQLDGNYVCSPNTFHVSTPRSPYLSLLCMSQRASDIYIFFLLNESNIVVSQTELVSLGFVLNHYSMPLILFLQGPDHLYNVT
jgi:hypothetical protein